jgi:hypothetical protein
MRWGLRAPFFRLASANRPAPSILEGRLVNDAQARGFFAPRWRGQVPPARLFWRDIVLVGSVINLAASFLALMLAAQGVATAVAVGVHLAPLPYNLFLCAALWRHPGRTSVQSASAGLWLALATLL